MKTNSTSRNRSRKTREKIPTAAQISRQRTAIQSGWSTREKQHRRIDGKHQIADARFQAHVQFLRFLVELEAQNG